MAVAFETLQKFVGAKKYCNLQYKQENLRKKVLNVTTIYKYSPVVLK